MKRRVLCAHCKKFCKDEVFRLSRTSVGDNRERVVKFCCRECLDEYLDLVPRSKSKEEVKKEANELYKLVCPACKRRIRGRFE